MGAPEGFDYIATGAGGSAEVRISHHGRRATTLRAAAARRFLEEVETGDAQQVMARATGNYRRGNERRAREHPRNRGS